MTHLGKQILLLYFYPRPPRGGRLANLGEQPVKKKISIHALREEGDCHADDCRCIHVISIHALREEGDPQHRLYAGRRTISIHALREEGDLLRGHSPA